MVEIVTVTGWELANLIAQKKIAWDSEKETIKFKTIKFNPDDNAEDMSVSLKYERVPKKT